MMSGHGNKSDSTTAVVFRASRGSGRSTLEKISQLEQRVVSLERERNSQLYNRRHEFRKVFCSLEETEIKLNQERKTEKKELSQQISRIRANVQGFQKMLGDMKPGPTFMERLKEVLEETEASILAFKDRQRQVYEELLVEERQVSQEVMAFQRRTEAWTTTTTTTGPRGAQQVTAPGERGREGEGEATLPPAVLAQERFLRQTEGVLGGWDDYDHNTFLHLRAKHSNERVLVEAALRELPTRSEAEVRAHAAWYTEYSALVEAKRLAIQQWKKNKELARSEQLKAGAGAVRERDSETRRKEEATEREKREQERQLNKEKLQAWKGEQEQKRHEEEDARLKEEEMKTKQHEKQSIRQAEVRERVRQYQESRERERQAVAEEERQRTQTRERELQLMAKREIQQFRERDMRAVAERKERDREKEAVKMEQKMRLDKLKEQVVVRVSRDPDRVMRPTSGWQERKKAREKEREEGGGGGGGLAVGVGARDLPRRAVPAWRQGL